MFSSSRIGNTEWCKCNNCRQIETDDASLCCAEADEIHKEMFEGKLTLRASDIKLNNATLFQDIYSNKLSLRLIWLMFFSEYIL